MIFNTVTKEYIILNSKNCKNWFPHFFKLPRGSKGGFGSKKSKNQMTHQIHQNRTRSLNQSTRAFYYEWFVRKWQKTNFNIIQNNIIYVTSFNSIQNWSNRGSINYFKAWFLIDLFHENYYFSQNLKKGALIAFP